MKDQVLTIEQMQELIGLGVDTSNASMYWNYNDEHSYWALVVNYTHSPYIEGEIVPTFTLQDILDLLPSMIPEPASDGYIDGHAYLESDLKRAIWYKSWHLDDHHIITFQKSSLLEAAVNMLIWCKQNNKL